MSTSTALTRYQDRYTAKKALFAFMGSEFRFFAPDGGLAFFVKQKAFKLKEEITVFGDEAQKQAMLRIKARGIGDFAGTYDVVDAATGETVGALKREGLKSLLRDEWTVLDAGGALIGKIQEDSGVLALLRRFIKLIPQRFAVTVGGEPAGDIQQRFNPFALVYDVDFSKDTGGRLDRRLAVAAVTLLLAIEGRQQ